MEENSDNFIKILEGGGVVVMPTDTLYGILGSALNKSIVERIYQIRKRRVDKPCIILIGSIAELEKFSIYPSLAQKNTIEKYWPASPSLGGPGPVSIVLDCAEDSFSYLHRGTNSLAFRMPRPPALRDLLLKVGPLIAPSANPEGLPPAQTILEAKDYFGDSVDLYLDGGTLSGEASKIIRLTSDGTESVLRE